MAHRKRGNGQFQFKVVVMGDQYCGKTSMIERYTRGKFRPNYIQTLSSEYRTKELTLDGKQLRLTIYDTAGQEDLKTIIKNIYRDAHGILLVFDFSRPVTLRHIDDWVELIKTNCIRMPEIVLAGNKHDLCRSLKKVPSRDGSEKAAHLDVKYLDVSARMNENISEAFETVAQQILKSQTPLYDAVLNYGAVTLNDSPKDKSSGCC